MFLHIQLFEISIKQKTTITLLLPFRWRILTLICCLLKSQLNLRKETSEPDYSLPDKQRPHPKWDKSVWRKEIPSCLQDKESISPYNVPTDHVPINNCNLTPFLSINLASYLALYMEIQARTKRKDFTNSLYKEIRQCLQYDSSIWHIRSYDPFYSFTSNR